MDETITSASVACTLTPASQRLEIKYISEEIIPYILNRELLENGSRLTFKADTELLNKIEALVELDKGCCAFLKHQLQSDEKNIFWMIRSEGAGVILAQHYLSEQVPFEKTPVRNGRLLGAGFKATAILSACGIACAAPLVLGAMGLGLTGVGLGALGAEITVLGVVTIAAGSYWYYKKKKLHTAKGTKNENRCSC